MDSNPLYQAALQTIPGVSVLLFDHNLCYTLVSTQSAPSFHREARVGCRLQEVMSTAYIEAFQPAYEAALTGATQIVNFRDADWMFKVQVQPVCDDQGQILGGMVTAPTTGQTRSAGDGCYHPLFNQTIDAVFLLAFDGQHFEWNRRAVDMLGYSDAELDDLSVAKLQTPLSLEHSQQQLAALMAGDDVPVYEHCFIHKSGKEISAEVDLSLVRDDTGEPHYIQSVVRDITARKEAESLLRTSEERYRVICSLMSDYAYLFHIEPDGTQVLDWVTDSMTRITGYTLEEHMTLQPQLIHPDDHDRVQDEIRRAVSGELIPASEYRIFTKSGVLRWIRVARHPVWDAEDQRVVRLYNVAQDITEHKEAELALRASEERYRTVSELISDYAFSAAVTPAGELEMEWLTGAFQRITGYDEQAILDKDIHLIHPDDAQQVHDEIRRAVQGETIDRSEYRIITRDGEQRWLQVSRRPVWDEREQRVIRMYNVAQDITQRKQTEAALTQNEERFRLITQATTDGLYDCDLVNDRVWRNDWYNRYLGRTQAVSGRGIWSVRIHPDDYEETANSHRTALAGDATSWVSEYRLRNNEGKYRTFIDRTYIVRNHEGKAIRAIGAVTDITEKRAYDQRAMDLRVQTERIQVLTKLVRAMSHDFRTPLTVINTSIYLLNRTDDPERQQYHFAKIQDQVARLEKLIDGLRTMAVLDSADIFEFKPVDVNRLVDYVQTHQQSNCDAKGLKLQVTIADNLPTIIGDDNWLDKALTNLVENAIQFTPAGNQITLRTYQRADEVVVEVQDTGVGMTAEQQAAVFTPLYRGAEHRPADNAYGLGLPITHKIVSEHHGKIELESVSDEGTTFRILFPVNTI